MAVWIIVQLLHCRWLRPSRSGKAKSRGGKNAVLNLATQVGLRLPCRLIPSQQALRTSAATANRSQPQPDLDEIEISAAEPEADFEFMASAAFVICFLLRAGIGHCAAENAAAMANLIIVVNLVCGRDSSSSADCAACLDAGWEVAAGFLETRSAVAASQLAAAQSEMVPYSSWDAAVTASGGRCGGGSSVHLALVIYALTHCVLYLHQT